MEMEPPKADAKPPKAESAPPQPSTSDDPSVEQRAKGTRLYQAGDWQVRGHLVSSVLRICIRLRERSCPLTSVETGLYLAFYQ